MVTTARANDLNPRKYLEWLLAEMPNAADPGDLAYLDSLMPWSDSAPDEIRLKPAAAAEAAAVCMAAPSVRLQPTAEQVRGFFRLSVQRMRDMSSTTVSATVAPYNTARASRKTMCSLVRLLRQRCSRQ